MPSSNYNFRDANGNIDPSVIEQGLQDYLPYFFKGPVKKFDYSPYRKYLKESAGNLDSVTSGIDSLISGVGSDISGIGSSISGIDTSISNLGENRTGLTDLITRQNDISQGNDARFGDYRNAVLDRLTQEQQAGERQTSDYFSRRGVGGSSSELNALNNLRKDFSTQRTETEANIGLQQLSRQDQALANLAGLYGQRSGIDLQSAGLEGQKASLYNQQAGLRGLQSGFYGQKAGVIGQQAGLYNDAANITNMDFQNRLARREQYLGSLTAGIEALTLPYTLQTAERAATGATSDEIDQLRKQLEELKKRPQTSSQSYDYNDYYGGYGDYGDYSV